MHSVQVAGLPVLARDDRQPSRPESTYHPTTISSPYRPPAKQVCTFLSFQSRFAITMVQYHTLNLTRTPPKFDCWSCFLEKKPHQSTASSPQFHCRITQSSRPSRMSGAMRKSRKPSRSTAVSFRLQQILKRHYGPSVIDASRAFSGWMPFASTRVIWARRMSMFHS